VLTRIEALNYRSLRYISQKVSPFQTLVGPNGSGKSTFLDVVGFLGDMLRVGPLRAIQGEGITVPQRASDPSHLCWMRQGGSFELAVEMEIPADRLEKLGNGKAKRARYEVRIEVGGESAEVRLATETFWLIPTDETADPERPAFPLFRPGPETIVRAPGKHTPPGWKKVVTKNSDAGTDYFISETTGWNIPFRLGPNKSAFANLPEDEEKFPVATWAKRFLM